MTDQPVFEFTHTENGEKAKQASVQARAVGSPTFDNVGGYIGEGVLSRLLFGTAAAADEAPPYNPLWSMPRDRYLRNFYRGVSPLAGAVYSLTARLKSLDFEIIKSPIKYKKYSQTILKDCEQGRGIRDLIGKVVTDVLTTDNGAFVEICGAGNPLRPLTGQLREPYLMHLDSNQCWRTFEPEYPVVYINPLDGQYRKLHYTRVVSVSSFTQPDELGRGIGFSPVSRILRYAQYIRDVIQYKYEKTSGRFTRSIITGSGINQDTLMTSLMAADRRALDNGFAVYKGIPIVTRAGPEPINLNMLDLASIGDGFDTVNDMQVFINVMALCFGVDTREFYPATGVGATKADATVQHLKAQGKGIGDLIEMMEHIIRMALPPSVEFRFDFKDDEQDEQRARVRLQTAQYLAIVKADAALTPEEYRAIAIGEGLLDIETLNSVTESMLNADPITDDTPTQQVTRTTDENIADVDAQAPQADSAEETEETKAARGWQVSAKDYTRAANAFVRAVEQSASPTLFPAQLRRAGDDAYLSGVRDAGGTLTAIDRVAREQLAGWVASQADWIRGFQERLELTNAGELDTDVRQHADMWANKSLYDAYFLGLVRGNSTRKATWTLGIAEHCVDCLALSGQTKTMQEWDELGIRPRSSELACKGINCKCTLVLS